jgi:hypothetical protein
MRTVLLVPIVLTLAALQGHALAADASAPAIPAPAVAITPPVSSTLPQPRPSDVELARRRMTRCRTHPEICEQQKKEERAKKEKGGTDSGAAPPSVKPPPESSPR